MQLRWSLAILSLTSFVCTSLAIPIPGGGGDDDPKKPSKDYRDAASKAPYGFQATPGGSNVNRFLEQGPRPPRPFEDADHLLEAQTLHRALRDQGVRFSDMPMHHRAGIREILNHPNNMAFIDRSLNRGKGQVVRQGQEGRQLSTANPTRDAYVRATIPNAHHTAQQLDNFLIQHGYQGNVAHTHRTAMEAAGHLTPGRPIPALTPAHGHAGPSNLAHQLGNLNLHGHGSGSSSEGSSHSSPSSSRPHSPSPAPRHPSHGPHGNNPPSTPPRTHRNGPDPTLGTHAPARVNRANERFAHIGPIQPIPSFESLHPNRHHGGTPGPSTPHHGNAHPGLPNQHAHGGAPSTPARQTGPHPDHHNLGHNAPPRPERRNSFGGTPAVHRPMIPPHHDPPSPSHHAAEHSGKGKGPVSGKK